MKINDLNMNVLLDRTNIETQIKTILTSFSENCKDVNFKKGIYLYGSPGCGKTQFVLTLLREMDFDVIKYDAGDVRNKTMIDTITSNNISNYNVLNLMKGKPQKIAIVMDEIDGMNSGDKGGITALIKLIRQKKTKKQRLEHSTVNPIVCIGNYFVDKKIKELMKVCHVFELKSLSQPQVETIVSQIMPEIRDPTLQQDMYRYVQSDMRKIAFLHSIYTKNPNMITTEMIRNIFHTKNYNDDSKRIIHQLFESPVSIEEHNMFMNETDRTTVALLWHENVVDKLKHIPKDKSFAFYLRILQNMCFADYMDRITFQNQIWIFNEMTSLIKTFHNNKLFHEFVDDIDNSRNIVCASEIGNSRLSPKALSCVDTESPTKATPEIKKRTKQIAKNGEVEEPDSVRFTKVLTKYSTEYNNIMFVFMLCQEMEMEKADAISFFQELRLFYGADFFNKSDKLNNAEKIFANTNISKLDIKRVYRYLDKNVKRGSPIISDDLLSDEEDDL